MNKFLKFLTVSVAALSLVGLASCGGEKENPTHKPTENPTVTPTVKPTPEPTPEPTPSKPVKPEGEVFMNCVQDLPGMGKFTAELYLQENKKFFIDITSEKFDFLNETLDQAGTYSVMNGLYRFIYSRGEGDAKEDIILSSLYNKTDKTFSVNFIAKGDKEVPFLLKSKAQTLETEPANIVMTDCVNSFAGPISCDVVLLDETNVKFDLTTGMADYNDKFDVTGTYTLTDGKYTFVLGDKTYTPVLNKATNAYNLEYTVQGDMKLDFNLSNK